MVNGILDDRRGERDGDGWAEEREGEANIGRSTHPSIPAAPPYLRRMRGSNIQL